MKQVGGMTLFFSKNDAFSNWFPCRFTVKGVAFNCVEQYMMFAKAKLFGDHATADRIMQTDDPREHKRLGRQVNGFVDAVWVERRQRLVALGCYAKFSQNPELGRMLLDTGDTLLVEASPYDGIWGVKLGANDPSILDQSQWRGMNLLGYALMEVRSWLRA